jgi:hypothetical protein
LQADDGWQWVPKEPTKAMLKAAHDCAVSRLLGDYSNEDCKSDEERSAKGYRADWAAMLAAAPKKGQP